MGDGETNGIAVGVPLRDDGHAIAKFDQAIGLRIPIVLDGDRASAIVVL